MSDQFTLSAAVLQTLRDIVGEDKVRLDAESLDTYGKDWTKVHVPKPNEGVTLFIHNQCGFPTS